MYEFRCSVSTLCMDTVVATAHSAATDTQVHQLSWP